MILITVDAVSFVSLNRLVKTSGEVALTYEMLDQLDEVLLHLQNAETGQRGYLITGQESYLEPYEAAIRSIDEDLARLQTLTETHPVPVQRQHLLSLNPLIATKLAELDESIRIRRHEGFEAAKRLVETDHGKLAMDRIRLVISDMKALEAGLLLQRTEQMRGNVHFTLLIILVGSQLGLALLVFAAFIINRDFRKRAQAERERDRLEASLRRSEKMSAMGALVAGVAHEVRNPLFAISSTLDAMEARFNGRECDRQPHMRVLRIELERLQKLMRQLLDYGKLSDDPFEPCHLPPVLAEAVEAFRPLAESGQIRMVTRVCADLPPVRIGRERLFQVFQNLIENAIRHVPAGGTVAIAVEKIRRDSTPWVECVVEDDGPGFDPQSLSLVFEPFFSGRNGGTGLGLSIVQRIVDVHGGEVCAGNKAGGGAIVTIRLPLVAGDGDGEKQDSDRR
ncbi:MAG TPA: CHASE3 domain-containing protein [Rhodocyclaceae bacterium]|nr:CHASE3 domain-containing protein [Rhodocyclaceae bacterium]